MQIGYHCPEITSYLRGVPHASVKVPSTKIFLVETRHSHCGYLLALFGHYATLSPGNSARGWLTSNSARGLLTGNSARGLLTGSSAGDVLAGTCNSYEVINLPSGPLQNSPAV